MSTYEREERRHTRDDYDSAEDYLRYLRESGIEPIDLYGRARATFTGPGPEAARARAIYGEPPKRRTAKSTTGLAQRDVLKLYRAVAFANLKGLTLETFTTIAWSTLGYVDDRDVAVEHRHFMELFRHWCADNSVEHAAIWTMERGEKHGLHTHVLAHVPEHMQTAYRVWAKGAIERRTGQKLMRPVWDQAAPKVATLHIGDPKKHRTASANQWELFHYMTKGIYEPHLAKLLKATHSGYLSAEFRRARLAPQGQIDGKRCGPTRSLDVAAQAAFDQEHGLPAGLWPQEKMGVGDLRFDDAYLEHAAHCRRRAEIYASLPTLDV